MLKFRLTHSFAHLLSEVGSAIASKTTMKHSIAILALTALSVQAFTAPAAFSRPTFALASTTAEAAGVPPTAAEPSTDVEDVAIPSKLPSDVGMDYIPLATMLATGQLSEADQVGLCWVQRIAIEHRSLTLS